ncbi:MAG TPA: hypothetical protein GX531_05615 [Methanothermobacter sp.]|nr:hypothetical protein [Methanothermobacter sp.]
MKRVTISIPAQTDLKFRQMASQKFKFEKGWYSKAIIEAIKFWVDKNEVYFLNDRISKVSREIGKDIWCKTKIKWNIGSENNLKTLDSFINYFNGNYIHINELDYEICDNNIIISITNHGNRDIDNYIESFLFPLIMVTRSGMEEITGDQYEIRSLGDVSKITLTKKLNSTK